MTARSLASTAEVCIRGCDHGHNRPLTLDEAVEQVRHPLTGVSKDDLHIVVAYLACQVVGLQHRRSASAELALHRIEKILRERADAVARGAT